MFSDDTAGAAAAVPPQPPQPMLPIAAQSVVPLAMQPSAPVASYTYMAPPPYGCYPQYPSTADFAPACAYGAHPGPLPAAPPHLPTSMRAGDVPPPGCEPGAFKLFVGNVPLACDEMVRVGSS